MGGREEGDYGRLGEGGGVGGVGGGREREGGEREIMSD